MNKRSGHKRSRRTAKKAHKKERRGTRGYRKGSKSKTMKGKKDFTTKKTSKVFNRRKHYQKHAKGSRVNRKPYHKKKGGSYTIVYPFGSYTNTNSKATSSWPSQGTASGAKNWHLSAWLSPTGHPESAEQIATRSRKQKAAAEHRLHEEGLKVKPNVTRLNRYVPLQFY